MKAVALALALLATGGCLATDPAAWGKPARDEVKQDIWECEQHAQAVMGQAAAFGGAIVPLIAMFRHAGTFNKCMEAKGYRKGE